MVEANADQRAYWNSGESREWVDAPHSYDEMLAPFLTQLVEVVAPVAGERVLDIGCGNGATTLAIAERVGPDGTAVGVDLSAGMVRNAQARAEERRIANAAFVVADAQVDELGGPFDAVVSRFGIMFFDDPAAAFGNIVAALAPGGRLAFVCWRSPLENEWVAVQARVVATHVAPPGPAADAPGPFRYAEPAPMLLALEHAGLSDVVADQYDTPLLLGGRGTLDDAMAYVQGSGMLRGLMGDVSPDVRARVLDGIRDALAPFVTPDGVRLGGAVWVVSGRRR